ncbi:ARMADILLO BTB ARABIDOPSIS PROTEIN 1-like [Gigantopelta aegis]|uniref:ARMADILLO BTB ARABIDOPSIS PROTEIN 1-like n=1 Tax=Gigantopelta aegis TaxID=1735272 RepID=UPI001B88C124|nr:ARMADILLO BTB ARABIDOPSIS PROTEIN 1-like [Gigantopelta aegis]
MSTHNTSDWESATDTDSYEDEPNNMFSAPSATSDVILLVEDKPIHVNKAILSLASPVFAAMFELNFKEKHAEKIPLPGKKYEDFIEFLLCLYPNTVKDVDRENIDIVLPLADEYQVENIKRRSEAMILLLLQIKYESLFAKDVVHFLFLSDKYSFKQALVEATNIATSHCCTDLFEIKEFNSVSSAVKIDITTTGKFKKPSEVCII